jgi:uncharacterized protein YhaN
MSYDMEMEEYHEERLHRENELLYKKNKPKHKHNIILEFIKATSLILILILQIMLFFKLN